MAQLRQMQDVPHIPHMNTSIPGSDYVLPEVTEEEEQALEEDPVLHAHDEDELAWLRRLPSVSYTHLTLPTKRIV